MTIDLGRTLQAFFDNEILPRHRGWSYHVVRRREPEPFMRELRAKARAAKLWNLGLPDRISNHDYAQLAELMGQLPWAPEVVTALQRRRLALCNDTGAELT